MSCYEAGVALSVPQDGIAGYRGRCSLGQVLRGLEYERESCTSRPVEEFRVSDKLGAVAKYLSEGERGWCEHIRQCWRKF